VVIRHVTDGLRVYAKKKHDIEDEVLHSARWWMSILPIGRYIKVEGEKGTISCFGRLS
jgi:hypothetical protein